MDSTAKEITFDENGVCNFCHQAQESLKAQEKEKGNWLKIRDWIMRDTRGEYDCIIGLSGGVDSSMALAMAIEEGLRPFCFTVDNGWNTPEADENILKLVETFKVPLEKIVLDRSEFFDIQASFLKAGLINCEIPTDHVLMAVSLKMADKLGIKWIISGGNVETESIMPSSWSYTARDLRHIKDVHKKKIKKIPVCGIWKFNWYKWIKRIKTLYILDYTGYNRNRAIEYLKEKCGYVGYGEKHCESVFTQWFQNFYLFEKFGIDKRKPHLSSMINSGQITREEALNELAKCPVYPMLGIEASVMANKKRNHSDFKTDEKVFGFISKIIKFLKDRGILRRFQNIA